MGRVWSICRAAWKGHPLCHSHWALHSLSLVGSGCSPLTAGSMGAGGGGGMQVFRSLLPSRCSPEWWDEVGGEEQGRRSPWLPRG